MTADLVEERLGRLEATNAEMKAEVVELRALLTRYWSRQENAKALADTMIHTLDGDCDGDEEGGDDGR